jgi:hypothetical protein
MSWMGRPGLRWSPERMKPAATDLLDVLPHAGEVGGRENDGEVAVTARVHELKSSLRGGGAMGIERALSEMGVRVSADTFIGQGRGDVEAIHGHGAVDVRHDLSASCSGRWEKALVGWVCVGPLWPYGL